LQKRNRKLSIAENADLIRKKCGIQAAAIHGIKDKAQGQKP
jgi:hypothetical protein